MSAPKTLFWKPYWKLRNEEESVCKHTVDVFLNELSASNSKDVLKLGHDLQTEKHRKTIIYKNSELRLIEALENVCENFRKYKVHKDKKDHERYSPDESATFKTLNALRDRGVKVNLGFPDEMWNAPDAEVVKLKTQCENMVEEYEEDISEWYYKHQDSNLYNWLCRDRILSEKDLDKGCLKALGMAMKSKRKRGKLTNKTKRKEKLGKRMRTRDSKDDGKPENKIGGKGNKVRNKKSNGSLNVNSSSKREDL
ncbi:protein canopy 4-like [Dendronephthya gigantea]|uniref:protein canopy 4-like n=1 Tax=Dendronephthya gigantea TaxID=151771 RepID=UPI00106B9ED2|nr:protein canopy 4-like [Dendronephthya gigantea]